MKKIIFWIIKQLAAAILHTYQPQVIGVTGSVGKTSTKEAIYAVLAPYERVRRSINSYNSESGLPLTIIGAESPRRNILGWILVICKGILLLIRKDSQYPQVLILEMGADRPGNIAYLAELTHPQIGVVTAIAPVHTEFLGSIEQIAQEKGMLIAYIPENGFAILNYDDERVRAMQERTKGKIITYGVSEGAQVHATDIQLATKGDRPTGVRFTLHYADKSTSITLPSSIGKPSILSALAGASVGIARGLTLEQIAQTLATLSPPKGRMNVIAGINSAILLDDTYNASPSATIAALETLAEAHTSYPKGRTVAIIGDMLELGEYSEQAHREVGQHAQELGVDLLITVGDEARLIGLGAQEKGMRQDQIRHFDTSTQAAESIVKEIHTNDMILIKGSQGARMELVTKALLARPENAASLLARQYAPWI